MSNQIKPCPFCGSEAAWFSYPDGTYEMKCRNPMCLSKSSRWDDVNEAIAAWNRRDEHTCTMAREGERLWKCDRCGSYYERADAYPYEYCPRCGAKVIGGASDD
jgi:DNA-directed RNA polymerase subunit RPC12/RpoP